MTLCFLSNYLTHHQLPFCLEMVTLLGDGFFFVETERLPLERKKMGYQTLGEQYDFVIPAFQGEMYYQQAMRTALESDVVIIGSAPDDLIRQRMRENKLTFRYSERIFKKNKLVLRWLKHTWKNFRFRSKNLFYLLSSAYAAEDYRRCGVKPEKMFQFGYFPETIHYDLEKLLQGKAQQGKLKLLWVGRLLDWKHPEHAVEVVRRLKEDKIPCHLNLIGTGECMEPITSLIARFGLENEISLLGSRTPEQVRTHMEQADVFLFTSDYGEGWGAVVNEAMNSGCVVVASHAAGSVPFLIHNGKEGLVYESGNIKDLYFQVKSLYLDPVRRREISTQAYRAITQEWNAFIAAKRLISISEHLLYGKDGEFLVYPDGVLSKAACIKQKNMAVVMGIAQISMEE